MTRTRGILGTASVAIGAFLLATIVRVPVPFPDVQLYASIARGRQLYGVGVPTITWNSPVAVDHIPFYGPVFYSLCSWLMQFFGVSLLSFRLVSLLGTSLIIAAAVMLARQLSGSRDRWLWVILILLLAPEVEFGLSTGAMHMLAIGLQMMALAVFARGLPRTGRAGLLFGSLAGLLVGMSALTTPRSYLFIASFLVCWLACPPRTYRREGQRQFAALVGTLALVMAIWATVSHGNPVSWARYMLYIFFHEDTDVAILPTAIRVWDFNTISMLMPLAATIGALAVVYGRWRQRSQASDGERDFVVFAVATGLLNLLLTFVIINLTWTVGEYFGLPLLIIVLAAPSRSFSMKPAVIAACVGLLIAVNAGRLLVKTARVAATWSSRDPTPLNEFVRSHVPPGSEVVGPEAPYFFPVERSGSRYRTVTARSWADWARWVPTIEPGATTVTRAFLIAPPRDRFFIWPVDDDPRPDNYACADDHLVAEYVPPHDYLNVLGPMLAWGAEVGYPRSRLYRLPPGCPVGYDPTASRWRRADANP